METTNKEQTYEEKKKVASGLLDKMSLGEYMEGLTSKFGERRVQKEFKELLAMMERFKKRIESLQDDVALFELEEKTRRSDEITARYTAEEVNAYKEQYAQLEAEHINLVKKNGKLKRIVDSLLEE